jgi:hypothetical protein
MKCSNCNKEATTNGTLAFTKPFKTMQGKIPEDISGEYCEHHTEAHWANYSICYRPADISRAEARK